MSNKSKRDARDLVPDHELWDKVAEIVKPLTADPHGAPRKQRSFHGKSANITDATALDARGNHRKAADDSRQSHLSTPVFTGLDRRTQQKLSRGQLTSEASLDLHGMKAAEARAKLGRFIEDARDRHLRLVLVITGKGASPYARHTLHGQSSYDVPERSGKIRKLLPQWLSEPGLSPWVNGFQPAHPRHGGGGAFYILLKRSRHGSR